MLYDSIEYRKDNGNLAYFKINFEMSAMSGRVISL